MLIVYFRGRERPDWELSSESETEDEPVSEARKDAIARKASRHAKEMAPKNKKSVFLNWNLVTQWDCSVTRRVK